MRHECERADDRVRKNVPRRLPSPPLRSIPQRRHPRRDGAVNFFISIWWLADVEVGTLASASATQSQSSSCGQRRSVPTILPASSVVRERRCLTMATRRDPQTNPTTDGSENSEVAAPLSKRRLVKRRKHHRYRQKSHAYRRIYRFIYKRYKSLRSITAPQFGNFLMILFTGLLTYFSYQLAHCDAAYLHLGQVAIDEEGFLTLPVENEGRRPSSGGPFQVYEATVTRDGTILEDHANSWTMPSIPPNSHEGGGPRDVVPYWPDHKGPVTQGLEAIYSIGAFTYGDGVSWLNTHYSWCVHTVNIKHNTEFAFVICTNEELSAFKAKRSMRDGIPIPAEHKK